MGLVPGETVTLARLLEGLMIVSGNDAALAIARHLDGSQPAFLERMNRHARQLGLRSSWFASVSGITTPHHASSARDMAVLAACLLNDHPQILAITAQRAFVHGSFSRNNQNALLGDDGVDGLKTGYTQAAGFCLAATACRAVPGRDQPVRLITVVLGSEAATRATHGCAISWRQDSPRWPAAPPGPDARSRSAPLDRRHDQPLQLGLGVGLVQRTCRHGFGQGFSRTENRPAPSKWHRAIVGNGPSHASQLSMKSCW